MHRVVPENIHTPPTEDIFILTPPPPRNFRSRGFMMTLPPLRNFPVFRTLFHETLGSSKSI